MSHHLSRKELEVCFLLIFSEILCFLSKWSPGQPNGDGTAAYYSTDSQVLDAKETKVGVMGVCVQEITDEFTSKSYFRLSLRSSEVIQARIDTG